MNKTILALAWIAGWIHVIWFTPTDGGSIVEFLGAVMRQDTEQVDPMVFGVFNLMGVWPLIMVAMLVQDDQGRMKAWPFAFSALILGNSALYVYLFFRRAQTGVIAPMTALVRLAESKVVAVILLLSTLAAIAYGISQGSFAAYADAYETQPFVNFMTVDFCLFSIAFAAILPDDLRRRGMTVGGVYWIYALVPLVGAVSYLVVRGELRGAGAAARFSRGVGAPSVGHIADSDSDLDPMSLGALRLRPSPSTSRRASVDPDATLF